MADRILDPATGVYIREMAGRSGKDASQNDTFMRKFLCYDDHDPIKCRDALFNQATPLSLLEFANLPLDSLSWQLHAGDGKWAFTADYAEVPPVGGYTVTMDTSGGTVNITHALAQQGYPAPSDVAPNTLAINDQGRGDIRGTAKVVPALKLNIRAKIPTTYVNDPIAYAKLCASVTGYTNSTNYLTFAPGELLYRGGSGEVKGKNPVVSHTFEASPNLTGITIGPVSGIAKEGHDYIWPRFKTVSSSGLATRDIRAIYVSRIYEKADFSVLRIGVA